MWTQFAKRVFMKALGNGEVASEIGYLMALQQNPREAHHWYSTALKAGASLLTAMQGNLPQHYHPIDKTMLMSWSEEDLINIVGLLCTTTDSIRINLGNWE